MKKTPLKKTFTSASTSLKAKRYFIIVTTNTSFFLFICAFSLPVTLVTFDFLLFFAPLFFLKLFFIYFCFRKSVRGVGGGGLKPLSSFLCSVPDSFSKYAYVTNRKNQKKVVIVVTWVSSIAIFNEHHFS